MKRREFLKAVTAGVIVAGFAPDAMAQMASFFAATPQAHYDDHIKDYLNKMQYFDKPHKDDVCLDRKKYRLLKSSVKRLKRLQRIVGHGNFYLLDFDYAIKIARNYSLVGSFSRAELEFLEMIFYEGAPLYGFFGEKPIKNLTARIRRREVAKVPNTGNYLYKGIPLETYRKIKQDVGDQVILTSGVRSVIKQFLLFLNKAYRNNGNLSLASRSLAPPGYSFHGIGDFDVGQADLGAANFTERFTSTKVYRKLVDLGYIKFRYLRDNMFGVRFEPWHIKINS
ncbi:MAG: D-alanyl-D-alanine carboxypeptidase family protein [Desulfobacterales bacterium]|nr:D-alanyl-D-alanine carboxypeptidase family protein [Desulfobacterales bacterium]